ncbi:ferredoxin family protein [Phenylobacterium sp.]|uniref:4Fe-4S dicluster domain-containing protein n=1 Tax=Phenylobacterium sp. TaxID=1871053 RepID=UPI00374D1854
MSDTEPPAARPSRLDPEKVSRASRSPKRVGERCGAPPGAYRPRVDPGRCEGKADCVAVCPHDVFEIGPIDEAVFRDLPLRARLKVWVHGKITAHTPHADACQACGLCVAACPELAITLVSAD